MADLSVHRSSPPEFSALAATLLCSLALAQAAWLKLVFVWDVETILAGSQLVPTPLPVVLSCLTVVVEGLLAALVWIPSLRGRVLRVQTALFCVYAGFSVWRTMIPIHESFGRLGPGLAWAPLLSCLYASILASLSAYAARLWRPLTA